MKIERADIHKQVESIITHGCAYVETVDLTAEKVMKVIWPLIQYLKDNQKK